MRNENGNYFNLFYFWWEKSTNNIPADAFSVSAPWEASHEITTEMEVNRMPIAHLSPRHQPRRPKQRTNKNHTQKKMVLNLIWSVALRVPSSHLPEAEIVSFGVCDFFSQIFVFVQAQSAAPCHNKNTRAEHPKTKQKNKSKISIWFQFSAFLLVCLKFVSLGRYAAVWCVFVCASSSAAFRMLFCFVQLCARPIRIFICPCVWCSFPRQ